MKLEKEVRLISITVEANDFLVFNFEDFQGTCVKLKVYGEMLTEFGLTMPTLLGIPNKVFVLTLDNQVRVMGSLCLNEFNKEELNKVCGGHHPYTVIKMKAVFVQSVKDDYWFVEQFELALTKQEYRDLESAASNPKEKMFFKLYFKPKVDGEQKV